MVLFIKPPFLYAFSAYFYTRTVFLVSVKILTRKTGLCKVFDRIDTLNFYYAARIPTKLEDGTVLLCLFLTTGRVEDVSY
jgi:hypothetical protein